MIVNTRNGHAVAAAVVAVLIPGVVGGVIGYVQLRIGRIAGTRCSVRILVGLGIAAPVGCTQVATVDLKGKFVVERVCVPNRRFRQQARVVVDAVYVVDT